MVTPHIYLSALPRASPLVDLTVVANRFSSRIGGMEGTKMAALVRVVEGNYVYYKCPNACGYESESPSCHLCPRERMIIFVDSKLPTLVRVKKKQDSAEFPSLAA